MWVRQLTLSDFRNFESLNATLINGVNILYGDNAQGKTNFLEALYFCARGRSQRAGTDRELIRFGQPEAHIRAVVDRDGDERVIDAHLIAATGRKGIAIDHIPIKKFSELFGVLLVVIFSPEDLRLVKAGPAERRAFMDMELCQLSAVYYYELRQYHHALKQRNQLLKAILKDRSLTDTVSVWDEQLCQHGRRIMAFRTDFVREINEAAQMLHSQMTGGTERLALSYRPHITDPEAYADKLQKGLERDIFLGSTYAGIHKDDIAFTINGSDARVFGSQGQQRTAALAAKLAEIELVRTYKHTVPLLLLDDVLSELDEHRQAFLLARMGLLQTVLTCTGVEGILRKTGNAVTDVRVMRVKGGCIEG